MLLSGTITTSPKLKAHNFADLLLQKNPNNSGFLHGFTEKITAALADMFIFHKPDEYRFLPENAQKICSFCPWWSSKSSCLFPEGLR